MILQAQSEHLRPTNPGGNYTNNGYPTRTPTSTAPPLNAAAGSGIQVAGDGVISVGHNGLVAPIYLCLIPFGVDASTHTFSFQVLGWAETAGNLGATFGGTSALANPPLWVPHWLGTWQATLGTNTGAAGSDIGTGQTFANAITQTAGPVYGTTPTQLPDNGYAGSSAIFTAGTTGVSHLEMMCRGFRYLEVIFTTGGVVTSCNALYRKR